MGPSVQNFPLTASLGIAFVAVPAVFTAVRRDLIGCLFLIQALLPWFAVLVIATYGHRPLLADRYFVFSQIALIAYWGHTTSKLPSVPLRLFFAFNLLVPTVVGAREYINALPAAEPSVVHAVQTLRLQVQPGDIVVTSTPEDLNIIKYYASRVGWSEIDVRCACRREHVGHVNHFSSLSAADFLCAGSVPRHVDRIWCLNKLPELRLTEWRTRSTEYFAPMDRTWDDGLRITLCERAHE
jgi:hypothetical protein